MERKILVDKLFEIAKENNITEIELYLKNIKTTSLNIYESNLEKYIISDNQGLSLRGIYNGKIGYSYTEKFNKESIDELLKNLIDYAENNHSTDVEKISSENIKIDNNKKENTLLKYTDDKKIEYLFELEKRAYKYDERIKTISNCSYDEVEESVFIKNDNGLELKDSHSYGYINLGAIVEENGKMQSGYYGKIIDDLKEEYIEEVIEESIGQGISMLNSKSINNGKYNTILKNNVASNLLGSFISVFLGNIVQQNLSLLKGKINSKIAVEFLNIIEDPILENAGYFRSFDDEGNLTYRKNLVENGVLKTFLQNNKTGEKENIKSTGNGFRQNHKSSIDIMGTNIFVEEGSNSLEELISNIGDGILITELHGLHAGINQVSGDFSLSSNGILIKEGRLGESVSQITIAGNLYELLNNIESIGNDTKFSFTNYCYFGSPSIDIGELSIAGK